MAGKYSDTVTRPSGAVVAGAFVKAVDHLGATATLYSDTGLTTPLAATPALPDQTSTQAETDSLGYYEFYLPDGIYSITESYGSASRTFGGIEVYDLANLSARAVSSGVQVFGELPSGAINGSNAAFTLANTPIAAGIALFLNGVRQQPGSGKDYTLSGAAITMRVAPTSGDILLADYQH